jgi:uncharacterized protein (DUF1684 family)
MTYSCSVSVAALVLGSIAGCSAKHDPPARAGLDAKDVPAWRVRVAKDREDKDREFATSPTSPLAGADRFTPTAAAYATIEGDAVRLDDRAAPATLVSFQPLDDQRWSWGAAAGVAATIGDGTSPVAPGEITQPTVFRLSERFQLMAQRSAGTFVVTAFDHTRKELTGFSHLPYFEPDPRFVVAAKLERFAAAPPVELATSRGLKKSYQRYATLRFSIDGQPCSLVAFQLAGTTGHSLFVPFRDRTSGKDSYGAARFLDIDLPADAASEVTLDFNAAYNPYCAYSPAWNCTLPPPENELAVAVPAGERTFGHGSHGG